MLQPDAGVGEILRSDRLRTSRLPEPGAHPGHLVCRLTFFKKYVACDSGPCIAEQEPVL